MSPFPLCYRKQRKNLGSDTTLTQVVCIRVSFSSSFARNTQTVPGSDTTLTQPAPQRAACSHQDLLQLRARRVDALQLLSGVLLPTATLLRRSPLAYREIGTREFASSTLTGSAFTFPNPDGQRSTTSIREFPYREIGVCDVMNP
jgi:hypothetical protein